MAKRPPLRERKKERTRALILEAATRLFLAKGFEHTTVEEIAEAAEVSRSTFFRYFPAKELAVFPYNQQRVDQFRVEFLRRVPGESAFAALCRAVLAMARTFQAARQEQLDQAEIVRASPFLLGRRFQIEEAWEDALAEGIRDRLSDLPQVGHQARMVAAALLGMVRTTLADWTRGGCRAELRELAQGFFPLLERGLDGWAPALLEPLD